MEHCHSLLLSRFSGLMPVIIAVAMLVTPCRGYTETVVEIVGDPGRFDGAPVSVHGVMKELRTHVNKKGVAYYTFYVSDKSSSLLVIAFGKPPCQPPTGVKVEGRFYRGANYIDATTLYCDAD